ncbi:hypothetical protein C5B92_07140 [Rathayibacter sp. AY1A4]|nr:hypothetical protein C5B92_07140 [Rathayibacter sp. AY1A4]
MKWWTDEIDGQRAPTPATSNSGSAPAAPQTDGTAALQPSTISSGTEALTDTGNAYLTMQRHARRLRYVTDTGKWAAWEGTRWVMAPDDAPAMAAALDTVRALPEDAPALHQHKKKSFAARALTNSVRILRGLNEIRTTADTFDTQNGQLNTPNGVIDLATGAILQPHPTLMHTRQTAVTVDFDLPTPQWDRFLDVTFQSDRPLIQFMQRLAGITAHGDTAHHVLPFLHGGGQNGKTVFLETLMRVLGDYATSAPQGFLLAGRDKHETELADLQGRRLVVASEVNENTRFDEAKMKALTGGDRIKARFMRQDFFTFEPTHTLWLMGNHQPAVASGGFSFWRRLRLIPFEHQITDEEKVDDLQSILARDEGPGILAWIVRGYADAVREGLGSPAAVREATASYAAEEDHLARFMEDRCRIGGGEYVRVDTAELRREYSKWCRSEHEDELVGQAFGRRLRQEFAVGEARSNGRRFYTNVTLYSDESDAEQQKEGSPWTGF